MAERAPLQQVIRRIQELNRQGAPIAAQVAEAQALGWKPEEIKARLRNVRPADSSDAAVSGLTSGWSDELSASLTGLGRMLKTGEGYGKSRSDVLEEMRAALDIYRHQNPVAAGLSEAAGSLALPIPGGPARNALTATLKGAGMGGLQGGLYGAGTGEDSESRAKGAVAGTVTGGVLGGGLGVAEGLYQGLSQLVPAKAKQSARYLLSDALKDEGLSGTQAADRIAALNAIGETGVTPADVAQGGRVMGLFEDVVSSPNRAQAKLREQIRERQMGVRSPTGSMTTPGAYEHIVNALGSLSGIGGHRAVSSLAEIIRRRGADAGPAFRQAYGVDIAGNQPIRDAFELLAKTPLMEEAWPRAMKIARSKNPGVAVPKISDLIDESGQLTALPNMELMHYLKEGMDDAVNGAFKSGDGALGTAYKGLRNQFRDALKTENPLYGRALDAFAGDSALKEAIEAGAASMGKSADELVATIQGLSASELEAFRVGAITKVFDVLGRKPRGPATDVAHALSSPEFVKKLAALMPNDMARIRWFQIADSQSAKAKTGKAMFGSPTAPRQEVAEMMGGEELAGRQFADAMQGMQGGLANMLMAALTRLSKPIAAVAKRARRGQMGDMLAATDQGAIDMLRNLDKRPSTAPYLGPRFVAGPAAQQLQAQAFPRPEPETPLY